jgi:hypothetical protein
MVTSTLKGLHQFHTRRAPESFQGDYGIGSACEILVTDFNPFRVDDLYVTPDQGSSFLANLA